MKRVFWVALATAMLSSACSCNGDGKCTVDTNCQKGLSCCGGACVDAQSDRANCGHCGVTCGTQNAASECSTGLCRLTCASGFGDCNTSAVDGCETKLSNSPANCGTCGNSCAGAHSQGICQSSICASGACDPGFKDCNASRADGCETPVSASATDCGDCGKVCQPQHAQGRCMNSTCQIGTCQNGFDNCNGNPGDGCETDLSSDPNHCGDCNTVCDANQKCVNSHCSSGSGLLLYGGLINVMSPNPTGDVTAYDTATHAFTLLTTSGTGPGPRFGHVAIWDGAGNRMIVWGGYTSAGLADQTVYALDFGSTPPAWSALTVSGTPPAARGTVCFGFDAVNRVLYLQGGATMGSTGFADSWALNLAASTWTQISPSGPAARELGVGAFEGGRFIIGLGIDPMNQTALPDFDAYPPDGGWSTLNVTGDSPGGTGGAVALGDVAPFIFFGGLNAMTGMANNRVFVADESDGGFVLSARNDSPAPAARSYFSGTASGGRRYVFGGYDFAGMSQYIDLWSFDLDGGWVLENPGIGLVDAGYPDAGTPVATHAGAVLQSIVGR